MLILTDPRAIDMILTIFSRLIVLVIAVNATPKRLYRPGNITIGVLLPIHFHASIDTCGEMYHFGLGYIEAVTHTIAKINKDSSILEGVTLGIDVRDYCDSPVLAVSEAHSMGTNNFLNDLLDAQENTKASALSIETHVVRMNITSPIAAVIGTEDSSSTSLVSSLLQVIYLIELLVIESLERFSGNLRCRAVTMSLSKYR